MFYPIEYNEPLFRPPAEAFSAIFQVTLGCSWNKCAFCEMYTQKNFQIVPFQEVQHQIKIISQFSPDIRKFFLADGNATVLSTSKLMAILKEINQSFKKVQRISSYALPKDILTKSSEELRELREAGLKLLYIGIESGDELLLKAINKSETYKTSADGLLKAHEAGIDTSVMIINGLGGIKFSNQHALNSAKVVNITQPKFLSVLALGLHLGENHYKKKFAGEYISMSQIELLEELKLFISKLDLKRTIFRSDHISNYLVLKGNFPADRKRFLYEIDKAINELGRDSQDFIPEPPVAM